MCIRDSRCSPSKPATATVVLPMSTVSSMGSGGLPGGSGDRCFLLQLQGVDERHTHGGGDHGLYLIHI